MNDSPKRPNNDVGFLVLWAYLMVLSIAFAPLFALAIKRILQ